MIATCAVFTSEASAQQQLWAVQFGTIHGDEAHALTPDGLGGVYLAGHTHGSLGGINRGYWDAYLAHYNDQGVQTWIRQFGTDRFDHAKAVAPDGGGGVYVAGHTRGNLGGINRGYWDAYLARYDNNGLQLWIRQFGTNTYDYAEALASDGTGGVYICGMTYGSLAGANAGEGDPYLAHYTGSGDRSWLRQFGTTDHDYAIALTADGTGVFVGGSTEGDLGGPSSGGRDGFLARYDHSGARIWIKQFGDGSFVSANVLASDGGGGVYIGGYTGGILGGPSSGAEDVYLAHYTSTGNQTWITQFGSVWGDYARALAPDNTGGVYIAGHTFGQLAGQPLGGADAFIAHYDRSGNRVSAWQFGTSENEYVRALATSSDGVFAAGSTAGSLGGPYTGGGDAFIVRFKETQCYPDCDPNGVLDIFDFLCFQNSFVAGEPYACDCDPDPACDIFDFLCFQDAFVRGCP